MCRRDDRIGGPKWIGSTEGASPAGRARYARPTRGCPVTGPLGFPPTATADRGGHGPASRELSSSAPLGAFSPHYQFKNQSKIKPHVYSGLHPHASIPPIPFSTVRKESLMEREPQISQVAAAEGTPWTQTGPAS